MGRYRKIDPRMWGDARFRRLSPLPPSGQGLWIHLLTGPHTTMIPGLSMAGEAQLAEQLGWSMEAFREAFAEAFREGLVKASWPDRVVWVQKAQKYEPPESPNVIRSWRMCWDEIPECDLKIEAYQSLKAFAEALGEGFAKAFEEACAKPSVHPYRHPSLNQEQEQEQEQEKRRISPAAPVEPVSDQGDLIAGDPRARPKPRSLSPWQLAWKGMCELRRERLLELDLDQYEDEEVPPALLNSGLKNVFDRLHAIQFTIVDAPEDLERVFYFYLQSNFGAGTDPPFCFKAFISEKTSKIAYDGWCKQLDESAREREGAG